MEGKIEKGINIAGIASNGVNTAVTNPAPKAPTKSDKEKTLKETYTEALKEKDGLDKEFKEVRKIKIGLTADITVGSVYRQINRQYIQDRHDSIGGSINSLECLLVMQKKWLLTCLLSLVAPLMILSSKNEFLVGFRISLFQFLWMVTNSIVISVGEERKIIN